MNFNEMISTEASPFRYTEFGSLKALRCKASFSFLPLQVQRFSAITIRERQLLTTAIRL